MPRKGSIDFSSFDPESQQPGTKQIYWLDVTALPGGDMLRLAALVVKGREPGPTLVALGGVHGDEYEGPHAIRLVYGKLDPADVKGSFIGVPQCNVPAFAAGTRTSPVDGLNLARIFPGDPRGTVTERIAWNLAKHVIDRAALLIDLHSSGVNTDIAPLIGYCLSESDLGRKSLDAALAFGMPALWGHPDLGPGRSISYAHERGIPWLYTETNGGGWLVQKNARRYADGVVNVLKRLGILSGKPNPPKPERHLIGDGNNDVTGLRVSESGYFVSEVNVLDKLKKGDLIGRVVNIAGETIDQTLAPDDGTIVLLRANPTVAAGDSVAVLTGEKDV